jgi:hypothetical protein
MAKYKLSGNKKSSAKSDARGLIPCAIVIIGGFILISLLFYALLKPS